MILLQNIGVLTVAGLILSLAAIGLTEAEARRPAGGGAYPANPLGLLVTRLMGWTALILIGLLALFGFGIVYVTIIALAVAVAIWRIGGPGISVTRYYGLRVPVAVTALLFAIALWLAFLSLLQGVPT